MEWRNVVCAIDTTPEALRLIRYAGEIASHYSSAVHLVHAVPQLAETRPEKYYNQEFEVFLKDSASKTIGEMQKEAGTSFRISVEAGKISVVAAAAQEFKANLVMTGRGALPRFGGSMCTHIYAIIRDAPCPVLSV